MKFNSAFFLLTFLSLVSAQPTNHSRGQIRIGYAPLIYNTVFSMELQNAIDINYNYELIRNFNVKAGLRTEFSPLRPEGYIGFHVSTFNKIWHPNIGIEVGLTRRAKIGEGAKLLRETRQAMGRSISPLYIAIQSAPLVFKLPKAFEISFLELHVGTHLVNPGRTLRLQLGILSIGKNL